MEEKNKSLGGGERAPKRFHTCAIDTEGALRIRFCEGKGEKDTKEGERRKQPRDRKEREKIVASFFPRVQKKEGSRQKY